MKQKGFTLVELMVVVVIVAILAAFAIPAYNDSTRKTFRRDVTSVMMEAVQDIERYKSVQGTFTGATLEVDAQQPSAGDLRYTITIENLTDTTYTIQAVPQNDQLE